MNPNLDNQRRTTTTHTSDDHRPASTYNRASRQGGAPARRKRPFYRHPFFRYVCCLFACALIFLIGVFMVYSYYYGMLNYRAAEQPPISNVSAASVDSEAHVDYSQVVSDDLGSLISQMNSDVAKYDIIASSDVTNILLIGVDDRDEGYYANTDTMMLVSICNNQDTIYMTSFMRDSWVDIPGYGYYRLNAANPLGGTALLIDTLEQNFKIHIDRYAMVNFMTFVDVVNRIDGVEVTLREEELEYLNWYVGTYLAEFDDTMKPVTGGTMEEITEPGTYNLNGVQALAYCRIRYVGDDFERTERQRKVLGAIFNKAKGLNIADLSGLAELLFPRIVTDIESMEMLGMCFHLGTYLSYDLKSQRVPADGTWYNYETPGGAQVVGIDLGSNIELLRSTIYAQPEESATTSIE